MREGERERETQESVFIKKKKKKLLRKSLVEIFPPRLIINK